MGGMCLGSYLLPRLVSAPAPSVARLCHAGVGDRRHWHRRFVRACRGSRNSTRRWAGSGLRGFCPLAAVAGVCLLPPTLLMGATLPAMSRWVETTPQGISWLGFFYGGNIAGAVFGCLLAGFYLLRMHDMAFGDLCRRQHQRHGGTAGADLWPAADAASQAEWKRRDAPLGNDALARQGIWRGLCCHCVVGMARWARRWFGRGCWR